MEITTAARGMPEGRSRGMNRQSWVEKWLHVTLQNDVNYCSDAEPLSNTTVAIGCYHIAPATIVRPQ